MDLLNEKKLHQDKNTPKFMVRLFKKYHTSRRFDTRKNQARIKDAKQAIGNKCDGNQEVNNRTVYEYLF